MAYEAQPNGPQRADEVEERVDELLDDALQRSDGAYRVPDDEAEALGRSAFDTPSSKDGTVTVLLPKESIEMVPSQALVRIVSRDDERSYLGIVVEGPFAEPDGLRADAPLVVQTTVRGAILMPRYHGRVHVELLGEELPGGKLIPPRYRPLPNSPVFALGADETAAALRLGGELRLGRVVGNEQVEVAVPIGSKEVLPRHTAILGTTGGGKSTTVAGLVARLQASGAATVVFDTEGEYTALGQPTEDPAMLAALAELKREPGGVRGTNIFHLVGRETRNPEHERVYPFALRFDSLAPEAVMEILELNEAQQNRFLVAYDAAKRFVEAAGLLTAEQKEKLLELDELEEGHPGVTLALLYDVVAAIAAKIAKEGLPPPRSAAVGERPDALEAALNSIESLDKSRASWRVLQGKLGRILRLKIFDQPKGTIDYRQLVQPGWVSIVDLSDTDSPTVNNLVIADLLRGIQREQERRYEAAQEEARQAREQGRAARKVAPAVVVVEEAHEFLSAERIRQMPVLFQQVARIARRGRKRWLGLVFVTQLPQHLPDEVFGLVNNYVLHRIADPNVVDRLRKTIGGIDRGLWDRLPTLAPGQAIVRFGGMQRPLLTAIDPAGAKLLMAE